MPPTQKLIIEIDEERAKKAVQRAFLDLTGFPLEDFRHKAERRLQRERGYGMVFASGSILAAWAVCLLIGWKPSVGPVIVAGLIGASRVWANR